MNTMDKRTTVASFVVEKPGLARVFERLGIDYCCGGQTALEDACVRKGLDVEEVLNQLTACVEKVPDASERDWTRASLLELTGHIQETYHEPLKEELARLSVLVEKVARVHGERHRELTDLKQVFDVFRSVLEAHMQKEDVVLFPMLRELDVAETLPSFHCGSVKGPIAMMLFEHDQAGEDMNAMRSLTADYTPPDDACNSYRALLNGLSDLESAMHAHVHKENNILFPRSIAREADLFRRRR